MKESDKKIRVLYSGTLNPWFNLATEDWIFREMAPDGHVLFLWRNSDTVVIGRYQNPWVECRLNQMNIDGVKLARRQSGGGAVFHDPQNLNFTFMSGADIYDKERNFRIITETLKGFGIVAETSGRNDILCDGRKISGSAFKLTKDRAFHHGTLLVDVDLGRLQTYLNPDAVKLKSKGIKSVRSRVANLKEFNESITVDELSAGIASTFFSFLGEGTEEVLDLSSLETISGLTGYYNTLKSDEWLFQKSPDFSHRISGRFDWGGIEINLDVVKGEIASAAIFTDSLFPEMIHLLEDGLKGTAYHSDSIENTVSRLSLGNKAWAPSLKDIGTMLLNEIKG